MNKAKAFFAAGVIVVVAAASAGLWYLNENGMLADDGETSVYSEEQPDIQSEEKDAADNEEKGTRTHEQETSTSAQSETTTVKSPVWENGDAENDKINDFLTVFAQVYFAEQGKPFDINNYDKYELIRFAYSHISNTEPSLISLEEYDDEIVYYYSMPYESINSVIEKYFGISVDAESVFTEDDYEFFKYSDGKFYTPAADGLAYINYARVTTVEKTGDDYSVAFDIYSDGEKYAEGEAKIGVRNGRMLLKYYKIYN